MNAELLALADKRAALSADLEKVQTELDQADLRIKELESRLAAQSPEPVACIRLRPYEIQSGLDRVRWAEGLIRQLPDNHDGRNAWLANYAGDKHDADKIRFTAQADYEQRIRSALVSAPMSASDGALRKALEPFAKDADNWADTVPDDHRSLCTEPGSQYPHPGSETIFTVGDLRRAKAVLAAASEATKSDGGLTPNATTIAAIEELERGGGEVGTGYGEFTPVTVRGSTSDPSSTRTDEVTA